MMGEIWKPVVGYEAFYDVSNLGRVRGKHQVGRRAIRGILKQAPNKKGYLRVGLCRDTGKRAHRFVHVLVLEAFNGPKPSEKHETNHIDTVKSNNRADNLEWVTGVENNAHSVAHGCWQPHVGDAHGMAVVTEVEITTIRALEGKESADEVGRRYGVTGQAIRLIWRRVNWKHVPTQWFGCYQDSWKGVITAASYQHPAKFAKGLVERILDYMAERKWIERGDIIGDPFGGVGTGGVVAAYRGYKWIGVELEPKFVKLADENFVKHLSKWAVLRVPLPVMMLGDSRYFNRRVDMLLSSPPYVSGGGHHTDVMNAHNTNGRGQKMKVHAVVSSPPYGGSLDDGGPEKRHPDGYERSNNWTGYGKSEGQIATLKSGDVDAVVGSPPFLGCRSDTTSSGGGINKKGYEGKEPARPSHRKMGERSYQAGQDKPRDPANIEVLEPGTIAAVIGSPPYETIKAGAGGLNHLPAREGDKQSGRDPKAPSQSADQTYGTTPGQIAHTQKAPLGALISSPPYADSINSDSHVIDFSKAKRDYPGRENSPARNKAHSDAAENMRYGDTPGQIGRLRAVVGSPPWEKNVEGGRRSGKFKGDAVLKSKRGKGASDAAVRAQAARDQEKTLGDSVGQIGQEAGETYWQAVAQVYHSCLMALKPGGVMALVVKDFCKDKKRMPLCDDTMRLLVWLGFEEVERIHAMLTEEQTHHDLFEGETVKRKERKSFFRRNYEKNMAPDDPRRIDFEEVLIVRKPL